MVSLGRRTRTVVQMTWVLPVLLALAACGGGGGGGGGGGTVGGSAPTNSAPSAQSVMVTFDEDVGGSGNLVGQDPDGNAMTYQVVATPANGSVSLAGAGPTFTYRSNADWFGTDQFSYTVSDGRATSAPAVVTVTVRSVNDPPTLTIEAVPSESKARETFEVRYVASDVDGNVASVRLTQLDGSPIAGSSQASNAYLVVAPNPTIVEDLALRLTAVDDGGAEVSQDFSVEVLPVSASGRLITVLGGATEPGIHFVLTGDGYTAAELPKLLVDARDFGLYTLETPPADSYKPAWNVHVLEAVSNESGMDIPSESIVRDTAFNATADCQGIGRLVCVDSARVQLAVATEFPAYDHVAVVVNSDRYGGSGGNIAVGTSIPDGRNILLHEFGHTFAGLADEYVDEAVAATYLPSYREDRYPNVTRLTDAAQTKWRHWFADQANVPRSPGQQGVGLFEGAYYHSVGFFRPTDMSFMRSSARRVMGEVNAEAWLLAIYRAAGAVRLASPAGDTVSAAAGTALQFSAAPTIGQPIQQITWLLNGTELPDSRNRTTISCCSTLTGTQTVSVIVQDVSGNIRTPNPAASRFQKSWAITIQ